METQHRQTLKAAGDDLAPPWRWLMNGARYVFGICGAVGAIAFIVHLIVFFYALHHGAAAPTGQQIFRITDHGDSAYVTYPWHIVIRWLSIVMVLGMGVGVGGAFLLEAIGQLRMKRKMRRGEGG